MDASALSMPKQCSAVDVVLVVLMNGSQSSSVVRRGGARRKGQGGIKSAG